MPSIELTQDLHVHSTFSDGQGTLEENIAAAHAAGLTKLGCVDHVRRDTTYVPDYVAAVRALRASSPVDLSIGVEAKILDRAGALDVPANLSGIDMIYVADHQFPWTDGPQHPRTIKAWLADGTITPLECVTALIDATVATMERNTEYPLLIAHLFSILPKIGLHEDSIPDELTEALARTAANTGATLEVSERWRCPSLRVVQQFRQLGVPIVASTDAHKPDAIGQYSYVTETVSQLVV